MAIHVEFLHKNDISNPNSIIMESGGLENSDNISKNVKFEFSAPCSVLQVSKFDNTLHFWHNSAFKKTGNVRMNVTFRHVRATIVAVENR
jgi:hypothetical protein